MYNFIKDILAQGNYVLSEMEDRILKIYARGKLTAEEMNELLDLAANNANDSLQFDIASAIADLEQRVAAIEAKGIITWTSGTVTKKGQTVLLDIDGDGILDYCRYDGGRASTSLRPGKIDGWVKTDANGNATHTITKDENGNIILVPIEAPAEQPEE